MSNRNHEDDCSRFTRGVWGKGRRRRRRRRRRMTRLKNGVWGRKEGEEVGYA
jgi:hypothetical protein